MGLLASMATMDAVNRGDHLEYTLLAPRKTQELLAEWSALGPLQVTQPGDDWSGGPTWRSWVDMGAWRSASAVRWCELVDGAYVDRAGSSCGEPPVIP